MNTVDCSAEAFISDAQYDAYGNEKESSVVDEKNPFGYAGEYLDEDTGFIYLRNRFYNPEIGRFISEDPYWNTRNMIYGDALDKNNLMPDSNAIRQSSNLYIYALNNPLLYIDASGLAALKTLGSGIFGGIDGQYIGGNQDWFSEPWLRNGGCGPTAAANILAYTAFSDPQKYGALYNYSSIAKSDFTSFMYDVSGYVKPGRIGNTALGVWWLGNVHRNVEKYAKDQGVNLKGKYIGTGNYSDAVKYIEDGLNKDKPVALIMHFNDDKNLKNYNLHWMVITEINQNSSTGNYDIAVSTWGRRDVLDFKSVWNNSSYAGVMYFE